MRVGVSVGVSVCESIECRCDGVYEVGLQTRTVVCVGVGVRRGG